MEALLLLRKNISKHREGGAVAKGLVDALVK